MSVRFNLTLTFFISKKLAFSAFDRAKSEENSSLKHLQGWINIQSFLDNGNRNRVC